jgi:hypothetical protein
MNSGTQYFTLTMSRVSVINGTKTSTQVSLSRCLRKDWEQLGSNFANIYDSLNFNHSLCPSAGDFFELQGT